MVRRCLRRAQRLPLETLATALAVATCVYVIGAPLWVARYPLMTDLPLHAANASALRHYFDADWHFREQLSLQPFAVPYMLFYVVAAGLMVVLPTLTAVKGAVMVMLALLPAGLATLFWGMRKSPLLGVCGLLFAWGTLASWGFLNFVGALGLWAMVIGVGLRAVDRPPREATLMLAAPLTLLFFTHPFRFPMALGSLVVVAVASWLLRKRGRSLVPAGSLALAGILAWWFARPPEIVVEVGSLHLELERLRVRETWEHPYASLLDGSDTQAFHRALVMVALLTALLGIARLRRGALPSARDGVALGAVALSGLAALLAYVVLPMQMASWWYIYPRELTAFGFVGLGLMPDLPRRPILRVAAVAWLGVALVPLGALEVRSQRAFDEGTADFERITATIPMAPKLLYLVFERDGSPARNSPFMHLPGYVQADKGGWSSFSFAWLGHSPFVFRDPDAPGAVVPPRPPPRWEWTPQRFDVRVHGRFFDWFLVRSTQPPDHLFLADPSIAQVSHDGTWWLYHRLEPRAAGGTGGL